MNIKKIKNKIIVTHELKSNEIYKVAQTSKFQSFTIMRKPQVVKGISNETEDNKGVLFIDYDNCEERIVLEDYRFIQGLFSLPQGYLFQTKNNNFHVICLKKFLHSEISEIIKSTRADVNYKSMPLRNPFRSYVLRLSDKKGSKKPKFLKVIGEENNLNCDVSNSHLNLLKKLYKIPDIKYKNIDRGKLIRFNTYETTG